MSRLWDRFWNDDMTFSPSIWYQGIIRAKYFPHITSMLYWWAGRFLIPNIIAKYAQIALYAIFLRTPAQPSTSESIFIYRDRKRIHTIIIIAIFLFTVLQVDCRIQGEGNYYRMLDMPLDADQKTAKKAFRIMAKKYHPDKVALGDPHNTDDAFIQLRAALSVISDPDLRHVYHRYGPSALDCTGDCRVDYNHISRALVQQQSFYIAWLIKSVFFAFRGNWHWTLSLAVPIAALATVEAYTVLENPVLGLVPGAFNTLVELTQLRQPYLPFEMVTLLRSVINASLFALSQLRSMKKNYEVLIT